jgi:hypothetical protein
MEREDLEKILEGFTWIKVKKYEELTYVDEYEEINGSHYCDLLNHHKKETEFLINKCRELATELLKYKEQTL